MPSIKPVERKYMTTTVEQFLETNYSGFDSTIYRDLSLNLTKLLTDGPLSEQERFMNLLAISTTLENQDFMKWAAQSLKDLGVEENVIRESTEVAGIMGMNNVYYKFRGYLPEEVKENYSRAGLRMQSLMKPVTGKANFEMMAMSVSIINGCPVCISTHEKSLTELGVTADKIHELARMAAVTKGLSTLKKTKLIF
ncbi:MAG: carboxymuconolactone decarboxylase family protein [Bdellovibrionota bacterium]